MKFGDKRNVGRTGFFAARTYHRRQPPFIDIWILRSQWDPCVQIGLRNQNECWHQKKPKNWEFATLSAAQFQKKLRGGSRVRTREHDPWCFFFRLPGRLSCRSPQVVRSTCVRPSFLASAANHCSEYRGRRRFGIFFFQRDFGPEWKGMVTFFSKNVQHTDFAGVLYDICGPFDLPAWENALQTKCQRKSPLRSRLFWEARIPRLTMIFTSWLQSIQSLIWPKLWM